MPANYYTYVLTHLKSGLVYVGSTSNKQRRIWEHQGALKRGVHANKALQRLYLDSPDIEFNFFPEPDKETALTHERDLIRQHADQAVNVISDPLNPFTTNPSLDTYRAVSAKSIVIDGVTYTSIGEASRKLGWHKQKIRGMLKSTKEIHRGVHYSGITKQVVPSPESGHGALIAYEGKCVTISELSRLTGIGVSTLSARKRAGVPDDKLCVQSYSKTIVNLMNYTGLSYSHIWYCLKTKGLTPDELISKYLRESNMEVKNIQFVIGTDIFKQEGDLYLITVNCAGIMGKGLAKSFKDAHPDLYERYRHDCRMKIITIGNPVIYKADNGKHYMMFPTKDRWQDPSLPDYISSGLQWMVDSVGEEGDIDPSWKIVIPPLGCANGGLSFSDVKENIKLFAGHMPNDVVVVYPPWMESDNSWD